MGTLIRHARPAGLAVSILPLPVAMVQLPFRASLVAAVAQRRCRSRASARQVGLQ